MMINRNCPLITVIITTHNCDLNIENSIKSVLNQSYKKLEVLIVDDNSTDKTLEICKRYENHNCLRIIKNKFIDSDRYFKGVNINAGYYSRNLGIKHSNGEWISFLDGGDLINESKIELQLKAAEKYNCMHILTDYSTFNGKEKYFSPIKAIDTNIDFHKFIFKVEILKIYKIQKDLAVLAFFFIRVFKQDIEVLKKDVGHRPKVEGLIGILIFKCLIVINQL